MKYAALGANMGENNPFYGKTHSDETKEKIKKRDMSYFSTEKYRQIMSAASSGERNGMYGKSVYQVWVAKHGQDQADKLMEEFKRKQRLNSSGEKNPMFGRPSPQGSGNGWSGWYQGWFFRSLKELSYVINVLEVAGDLWEGAESLGIKIPYTNQQGQSRNYMPDFLVNNNILVEVKPAKLRSSVTVRLKESAAREYVKIKNWEYMIVDPPVLRDEHIKELHDNKTIVFTQRYENKYKQLIQHK